MQALLNCSGKDITYLDTPTLQTLIDFKWTTYIRSYYMLQFYKTLIFIASFLLDVIFLSPDGLDEGSTGYKIATIITRAVCGACNLELGFYEVRQMNKERRFLSYFSKDVWNINDILLFLTYLAYLPVSFTQEANAYSVKSLQCAIVLFLLIKLNFYLRLFESFSFLIQMIVAVFRDLRAFIVYYCIIISAFSIQISLLTRDIEDHDGISVVKFFVMTLRTSLGDNDIDQENSQFKILFWIVWLLIMFVGNIVLMNFIIAVVGASYSNCMATNVAQSYKSKLEMIVECESLMSSEHFNNPHRYPRYIILVKESDEQERQAASIEEKLEFMRKEQLTIDKKCEQQLAEIGHLKGDINDIKADNKEIMKQLSVLLANQNIIQSGSKP